MRAAFDPAVRLEAPEAEFIVCADTIARRCQLRAGDAGLAVDAEKSAEMCERKIDALVAHGLFHRLAQGVLQRFQQEPDDVLGFVELEPAAISSGFFGM